MKYFNSYQELFTLVWWVMFLAHKDEWFSANLVTDDDLTGNVPQLISRLYRWSSL